MCRGVDLRGKTWNESAIALDFLTQLFARRHGIAAFAGVRFMHAVNVAMLVVAGAYAHEPLRPVCRGSMDGGDTRRRSSSFAQQFRVSLQKSRSANLN